MSTNNDHSLTISGLTKDQAVALISLWKAIQSVPGQIYLGDPKSNLDVRTNRETRISAKARLRKAIAAQFQSKYPLHPIK